MFKKINLLSILMVILFLFLTGCEYPIEPIGSIEIENKTGFLLTDLKYKLIGSDSTTDISSYLLIDKKITVSKLASGVYDVQAKIDGNSTIIVNLKSNTVEKDIITKINIKYDDIIFPDATTKGIIEIKNDSGEDLYFLKKKLISNTESFDSITNMLSYEIVYSGMTICKLIDAGTYHFQALPSPELSYSNCEYYSIVQNNNGILINNKTKSYWTITINDVYK